MTNLASNKEILGAQGFVEAYYHSLSGSQPISHFYVNSSKSYDAAPLAADISINGTVLPAPADYEKLVAGHGPPCTYEVESFDAHAVNPTFGLAAAAGPGAGAGAAAPDRSGQKMSLLVQVTGRITFGRGREAVRKPFNEVFVLVPNWEALRRNAPRGLRNWLIMSQNFRTL